MLVIGMYDNICYFISHFFSKILPFETETYSLVILKEYLFFHCNPSKLSNCLQFYLINLNLPYLLLSNIIFISSDLLKRNVNNLKKILISHFLYFLEEFNSINTVDSLRLYYHVFYNLYFFGFFPYFLILFEVYLKLYDKHYEDLMEFNNYLKSLDYDIGDFNFKNILLKIISREKGYLDNLYLFLINYTD